MSNGSLSWTTAQVMPGRNREMVHFHLQVSYFRPTAFLEFWNLRRSNATSRNTKWTCASSRTLLASQFCTWRHIGEQPDLEGDTAWQPQWCLVGLVPDFHLWHNSCEIQNQSREKAHFYFFFVSGPQLLFLKAALLQHNRKRHRLTAVIFFENQLLCFGWYPEL